MPISRRGQIFALAVLANIFVGTANIFRFEATATIQLPAPGPDTDTNADDNTDTNTDTNTDANTDTNTQILMIDF